MCCGLTSWVFWHGDLDHEALARRWDAVLDERGVLVRDDGLLRRIRPAERHVALHRRLGVVVLAGEVLALQLPPVHNLYRGSGEEDVKGGEEYSRGYLVYLDHLV